MWMSGESVPRLAKRGQHLISAYCSGQHRDGDPMGQGNRETGQHGHVPTYGRGSSGMGQYSDGANRTRSKTGMRNQWREAMQRRGNIEMEHCRVGAMQKVPTFRC